MICKNQEKYIHEKVTINTPFLIKLIFFRETFHRLTNIFLKNEGSYL